MNNIQDKGTMKATCLLINWKKKRMAVFFFLLTRYHTDSLSVDQTLSCHMINLNQSGSEKL